MRFLTDLMSSHLQAIASNLQAAYPRHGRVVIGPEHWPRGHDLRCTRWFVQKSISHERRTLCLADTQNVTESNDWLYVLTELYGDVVSLLAYHKACTNNATLVRI